MDYFRGVVVSAAALGVLTLAVGGTRLSKYCKQIISLLMIITVLFPFLKGTYEFTVFYDNETSNKEISRESFENDLYEKCASEVEHEIEKSIASKFGVKPQELEVRLFCDSSDISNVIINEVEIESSAEIPASEIEVFVREMLLCDRVHCFERGKK